VGRKGPSRHMKRPLSPTFWPIHRKEKVWAVKTSPGGHGAKVSTPLLVIVRDFVGYAKTAKEARLIIKQGKILVDGKPRIDVRYPVGLMDVVSLPDADETYRILPEHGGRFVLHPIKGVERGFKLCQIVGKSTVKGGKTQLNLHDGRNLLLEDDREHYAVHDILKLNILDQEVEEHIKFKPGVRVIITGGRSQGTSGILLDLSSETGGKRTATVRTAANDDVRTLTDYVFAVGTEAPIISLPGGE